MSDERKPVSGDELERARQDGWNKLLASHAQDRPDNDAQLYARAFKEGANWTEARLLAEIAALKLDLESDKRDWEVIAKELGCEPTREEMCKTIRTLAQARTQAAEEAMACCDEVAADYDNPILKNVADDCKLAIKVRAHFAGEKK